MGGGYYMETISIALACSVLSASISYMTFLKNSKKDVTEETKERIEVKVQLDYISRGIDDIKMANKFRDDQIKSLSDRVIVIEGEVKTLGSRMDKYDTE